MLRRTRFRIASDKLTESLALIRNSGKRVEPKINLHIALDPSDDMFLECAQEASAQYLVTGNKKHFPATWKSTSIVNARELIEQVIPDLKR